MALGLALCAVALSLAYPLRGYLQQRAAETQAVSEQHDLEAQIEDLNAQVAALKDPAYIRAEAKRRLQYVTPGDTVYVVKVPGAAGAADRHDSSPTTDDGYDVDPSLAATGGHTAGAPGTGTSATGTAPAANAPDGTPNGQTANGAAGDATGSPDGANAPWYASLWGTLTGSDTGSSGASTANGG